MKVQDLSFYIVAHGRAAKRMGGAQGKYKKWGHNIDCGRGSGGTPPENFEVLHALECVLGAPEAPFLCMHTVYTYLQVAIFIN